MRKLALLIAGVAAVAVMLNTPPAHAQAKCGDDICEGSGKTKVRNLGGLSLEGNRAHNDGGPVLTFSGRGTLVYDFPSIPATGANSGCQISAAGTATGCRFGDTVTLGLDQVPPNQFNANLPTAYISAADSFKVQVCNDSNDGGAIDWPDASFTARCFR